MLYETNAYVTLQGGLVNQLKGEDLRANDAFYLQNFKGIKNIGYHFNEESKKVGLGGDILGFDRYITSAIKISQDEAFSLPTFDYFEVEPFLFA